ncbi:MAG: thiamine phosphate synthase [Clostridiales bacterium]|nr:thiamine phosphate synthase [Clostridiales bacterium]
MIKIKREKNLYLVAGSDGLSESVFLKKIEDALAAGITLMQLREKEKEGGAIFELAKKVNALCVKYGVPLIIDDRADIALAAGAAGVHVGQNDLPVYQARRLMGSDKIVGATAKTVEQALAAQRDGADYVGVGAIYPTTTKVKTVLTHVSVLKDICRAVDIPVFAIGGLNKDNLDPLKGVNIAGIAVVTAIMKPDDTKDAVKELLTNVGRL